MGIGRFLWLVVVFGLGNCGVLFIVVVLYVVC